MYKQTSILKQVSVTHCAIILALLVAPYANSQNTNFLHFDETSLRSYLKKYGSRGLVIGIIKDTTGFISAYGKINSLGKKNSSPDGNTLFEIGSITKVFTTLSLAELVSRDSLSLNTRVADLLPPRKRRYSRKLQNISLQHLATHTSGFPRVRFIPTFLPSFIWPLDLARVYIKTRNPYAKYNEKKLLRDMRYVWLKSLPGKKYAYSNLGMGLLGYVLTQKSRKSYDTLLSETILAPLHMNNTWVHLPKSEKSKMATGHKRLGLRTARWTFREGMEGAGAVISSANDMMKFLKVNISDDNTHIHTLLSYCQQTYFRVNSNLEIGLGWHKTKSAKTSYHEIVWHNGGTGGFRSFLGFDRESKTGIVVLSNTSRSVDALAFDILSQYIEKK